jgi:hypothetical protein
MATSLPRLVGINHVALEVGDIEQALAFYGKSSASRCADAATARPSSTWATSSWRYPR